MLGNYFHHGILKKIVTGFGTLFNDIHIVHRDAAGTIISDMLVPIAYGPYQKFLAISEQKPDASKPIEITLPRISFQLVPPIQYDPSKHVGITQTFKACKIGGGIQQVYMPVPYTVNLELNIVSKLNDDSWQILEQILPLFQPSFSISLKLIDEIDEYRDIPFTLNNATWKDEYEGDFLTRRALVHTLSFSAPVYMFGPIADGTDGLIRKVQLDYYSSTDIKTAKRVLRYKVVPDPLNANHDDNYGFNESVEDFTDARIYSPTQQRDIDISSHSCPSLNPPSITGFNPSFLVAGDAGVTNITVTGTNFTSAATTKIGLVPTSLTYISPTQVILAWVSNGVPAGPLDVTITTLGGTATANIEVVPPPTIISFNPTYIESYGGGNVNITVTGTDFTPDATAMIGEVPTSLTYISPTQVILHWINSGAQNGNYTVRITTPRGIAVSNINIVFTNPGSG